MKKLIVTSHVHLSMILAICTLLIVSLMPLTSVKNFKHQENNKLSTQDTYTVINELPYYSKTTYYFSEEDFLQDTYNDISSSSVNQYTVQHIVSTPSQDYEFVMGINQSVSIEELSSPNGTVFSSRLLTYDEVINDQTDNSVYSDTYIDIFDEIIQSRYDLDIRLLVYKALGYDDFLYVKANARWNTKIGEGEQYADLGADDFMAITWGGNGEIKADFYGIEILYYDEMTSDLEPGLCCMNSYAGFCWQFRERIGVDFPILSQFGWQMTSAEADVALIKTYPEMKGKETHIALTYVHTYGKIVPSVGISLGTDSLAASLTLSGGEDYWQLQVDVPGILY